MARLDTWKSPLHLEDRGMSFIHDGYATITVGIRPKRWHPRWWWMLIRIVEPRYLWRPDVWGKIIRVGMTAGKGV